MHVVVVQIDLRTRVIRILTRENPSLSSSIVDIVDSSLYNILRETRRTTIGQLFRRFRYRETLEYSWTVAFDEVQTTFSWRWRPRLYRINESFVLGRQNSLSGWIRGINFNLLVTMILNRDIARIFCGKISLLRFLCLRIIFFFLSSFFFFFLFLRSGIKIYATP